MRSKGAKEAISPARYLDFCDENPVTLRVALCAGKMSPQSDRYRSRGRTVPTNAGLPARIVIPPKPYLIRSVQHSTADAVRPDQFFRFVANSGSRGRGLRSNR